MLRRTALLTLIAPLLVAPAAHAAGVTPECAAAGQTVAYHAVFSHGAPDRIVLRWVPRLVDPATGMETTTATTYSEDAGTVGFRTQPVASNPSFLEDIADGSVKVPVTKAVEGKAVSSWKLLGALTGADGTVYGSRNDGAAMVDLSGRALQVPRSVRRGKVITVRAKGFTGAAVARLVKNGKTVITAKLRPTGVFACGLAFGSLSGTSDLRKGTYTVVVAKTKGGKPEVRTTVRLT